MNNKQVALNYLTKLGIKPKSVSNSFIQISCPVCHDHSYKYRGYVLLDNPDTIIYNCFNCEEGATSFYNFLKSQDNNLAHQYLKESKREKLKNIRSTPSSKEIKSLFGDKEVQLENQESNFKVQVPFDKAIYTKTIDSEMIDEEFPLLELPQDALIYLSDRGFTREDYQDFKYCKESNDIVIPFWSNKKENLVYGMQMRNLTEKRFHNQNLRENLKISNLEYVLGLPKGSTIYLFESEFDRISSGIQDSIAVIGSKLSTEGEEVVQEPAPAGEAEAAHSNGKPEKQKETTWPESGHRRGYDPGSAECRYISMLEEVERKTELRKGYVK